MKKPTASPPFSRTTHFDQVPVELVKQIVVNPKRRTDTPAGHNVIRISSAGKTDPYSIRPRTPYAFEFTSK
jgi:hypothetical protein